MREQQQNPLGTLSAAPESEANSRTRISRSVAEASILESHDREVKTLQHQFPAASLSVRGKHSPSLSVAHQTLLRAFGQSYEEMNDRESGRLAGDSAKLQRGDCTVRSALVMIIDMINPQRPYCLYEGTLVHYNHLRVVRRVFSALC